MFKETPIQLEKRLKRKRIFFTLIFWILSIISFVFAFDFYYLAQQSEIITSVLWYLCMTVCIAWGSLMAYFIIDIN
tara:strand:- start:2119 stop:2346 length:228 start_codon:yes stop_codon:yes gene_type:complete